MITWADASIRCDGESCLELCGVTLDPDGGSPRAQIESELRREPRHGFRVVDRLHLCGGCRSTLKEDTP